jgi:KDO2-lipid IV(A) lauroyltransferase
MLATISRAAAAVPYGDLGVFGDALGAFVGSLLRIRRSHVEASMGRAGITRPDETAHGMYASLGRSFVEVLWMTGGPRDLASLVRFDARVLTEMRRGAVLAASHTGNWEIASCFIATRAPLLVVTKHLSAGFIDRYWQSSRARYGVTVTGAAGAYERARVHVRAGGSVAMMIDQVPNKKTHGLELEFLGERAWVDRSAATLAARAGVPMIVPAARRLEDGTQELQVLDVIAPPHHMNGRASRDWIDEATARATRALDRFVRENPTEWLWMHRRWKSPTA